MNFLPVCWIFISCLVAASQKASSSQPEATDYNSCLLQHLDTVDPRTNEPPDLSNMADVLHCDINDNLSLLDDNCITKNEKTQQIEIGQCVYSHSRGISNDDYVTLPANTSQYTAHSCSSFQRNGTLCGRCVNGYCPLVYSFNMTCVKCPNGKANWWKFVLAAFLPLTLLYFLILLFRVQIATSYLEGYVLFCQVFSMPPIARVVYTTLTNSSNGSTLLFYQVLASVFGIWNMDFLRFFNLGICLKLNSLETLVLDMAVSLYPVFLILLTYTVIKLYNPNKAMMWPCHALLHFLGQAISHKASLVDSFATFFILSYVKLLTISIDLLAPVKVFLIDSNGRLTSSWRLFYDATIPYFGQMHLLYGILGITVCALSVILPSILFILYPFCWFQKLLNLFPFRWYILHTFMDTFQGRYKDGIVEGAHDFRWFSSTSFLARILIAGVGIWTLGTSYFYVAPMALVLLLIFIVQFQPYKSRFRSLTKINTTFYIVLILSHVCALGTTLVRQNRSQLLLFFHASNCIIALLTFMYIPFMILLWMRSHRYFRKVKDWFTCCLNRMTLCVLGS